MSDYLAMINVNGIGSWARGKDKKTVLADVTRIFHSDWKKILNPVEKSPTVKIKVYDLENYDKVWWDEYGLYDGNDKHLDVKAEIIEHTFKKW